MTSFFIEKFYQFFEGILLFQSLFFGMAHIITKRRDVLYYSLLNFVTAVYFFLNAPDTFLGIDPNIVFNSTIYLFVNFALLLSLIFVYLIFLKEIFSDTVKKYLYVKLIYKITCYAIPSLYILFVVFAMLGWGTNMIFYAGHLINSPFCMIIMLLNFRVKGYKLLMIYAMYATFICIVVTMIFIVRYNAGHNDTILDKYPLAMVKVGMLIDIILFQLALLKSWNEQEKQLAVEKLQSQLEVERVRNKISGELHDDIGSTLSGVSMYSHMATNLINKNEYAKAKASLQVIQKSTDEMVDKLGDLVWSVNPKQDSLALLFERLEQYGSEMCVAKNIAFTCKIPNNITETNIPHEHRHHLYLMLKEAINNAVKYSAATEINFEASLANAALTITVADNGKGFDADKVLKGNGLDGMEKRAEEMGAEYLLETSKDNGCQISLILKITQ
jgi:signal transduction histidine kinase